MCTKKEIEALDKLLDDTEEDDGSSWKAAFKPKARQIRETNLIDLDVESSFKEKQDYTHGQDQAIFEYHDECSKVKAVKSHSGSIKGYQNVDGNIRIPFKYSEPTQEENVFRTDLTTPITEEEMLPQESLGTISPLLEKLPSLFFKEAEDESMMTDFETVEEMPLNSKSPTQMKAVDSYTSVSSQEQTPERANSASDSLRTTSSKSSFGGFLKTVRSQLSLTKIKKKRDKGENDSLLNKKFPKGYPVQPKLIQKRLSSESLDNEPSSVCVVPFGWNPNQHTDPTFKDKVNIEKFNSAINKISSSEGLVNMLPNWVSNPVVAVEDKVEPLVTGIEKECNNVMTNSAFEWLKALGETRNDGTRDFRRIFVYISGKIEFPNRKIHCLACSYQHNTLIIGGEGGMLKLLQIEFSNTFIRTENPDVNDVAYNILTHETCKGHKYGVENVAWHSSGNRFTSYDSKGVIVGWVRSNGTWQPEMIQDGSSSKIIGMAWSPRCSKVAFMYEDANECGEDKNFGIAIGLANGERVSNKELGSSAPSALRWIDETKYALIMNNKLTINHFNGLLMNKRFLTDEGQDLMDTNNKFGRIIAFFGKPETSWSESGSFTLAIIWEWNRMMLLRKVEDYDHLSVRTHLRSTCADWSANGMFIAIGGTAEEAKTMSQINIYNCVGKLLSIVKIPEVSVSSVSWDIDSSHLAIGANNLLYFGSVRPVYKFASTGAIIAYAFSKNGSNFLGMWDTVGSKVTTRKVPGKIVDLKSHAERFALLCLTKLGVYSVSVLNKTGCPIDTLLILKMEPFAICLLNSSLICLSDRCVLFWSYKSSYSRKGKVDGSQMPCELGDTSKKFRIVHIDDAASMIPTVIEKADDVTKPSVDPSVCMDGKNDCLCVARASGKIQVYQCPQGGIIYSFEVENFSPYILMFNPLADRIAMLDMDGCLRFATITNCNVTEIKISKATTEVLNMMWAQDMPYHLCILERTKIYILRDKKIEEEFCDIGALEGYLVSFENLEVTLLQLDNILENPEDPNLKQLTRIDMKIINRMKNDLKHGGSEKLKKLNETAEKRNHPRLWKILGEGALRCNLYDVAEIAFFKSKNYLGMKLLKKLHNIQSLPLRQAEIECFLENFSKAEQLYFEADRRDLAAQMWEILGDTNRSKNCSSGHKTRYGNGYHAILSSAEKHFLNGEFHEAISCYVEIEEFDRILECYTIMEDFEGMYDWVKKVPKAEDVLKRIADTFAAFGLFTEAVHCHLAHGEVQTAVTTALDNFQWNLALQISEEYNLPIVAPMLLNYTGQMIKSGNIMQAVQFLERCQKSFAAGKLLAMTALKELKENDQPNIPAIKKLFVMAAMQLTTTGKKNLRGNPRRARTKCSGISIEDDIDLLFDESIPIEFRPTIEEMEWMRKAPWRGAQAIQYFILVQKLIHLGQFENATKPANHLRTFSDILGHERVNCMIALASANGENYYLCSGALMSLEKFDEEYSHIALELFREKEITNKNCRNIECTRCKTQLSDYQAICPTCEHTLPVCVISGTILTHEEFIWICSTCKSTSDSRKVNRFELCPVCHISKCDTRSLDRTPNPISIST